MLEIFALIFLTRKIGEIVESKNRKAGWFKFITVVLWIGCEIMGAIVGGVYAALTGAGEAVAYIFALAGAGLGALVSFVIAKSLPVRAEPLAAAPPPPPDFRLTHQPPVANVPESFSTAQEGPGTAAAERDAGMRL